MPALDKLIRRLASSEVLEKLLSTPRGRQALSLLDPQAHQNILRRDPYSMHAISSPREFLDLAYPVKDWNHPEEIAKIKAIRDNWGAGLREIPFLATQRHKEYMRDTFDDLDYEVSPPSFLKWLDTPRNMPLIDDHQGRHRAKLIEQQYGPEHPFLIELELGEDVFSNPQTRIFPENYLDRIIDFPDKDPTRPPLKDILGTLPPSSAALTDVA